MPELIVRLINTGPTNTAADPGNAFTDDGASAILDNLETLDRDTGGHDGRNLGRIVKVEGVVETSSPSALDGNITFEYDLDSQVETLAPNGVQVFDVTAMKTGPWAWSDFSADNKLSIICDWADPVNALAVDYVWYLVTYTPTRRRKPIITSFTSIYPGR